MTITVFRKARKCQLHDLEVTTQPAWAPTGRLNQFNGFATPRPSLLPANAQMVYASVWAAWSAWSFCSDSKRIRVRACNTVRGFRCLGPNQQTEACDPATSPILGRPPRPNAINSDDYDTVDPWQEDRVEALKQLYPDETIDEKLNHLPDHEKEKLRARLLPPTQMSHELLTRPVNEQDGAPGATPERLFGARPKAFGTRTRAFAVPNSAGQAGEEALKFPELLNDDQFFSDITNEDKSISTQGKLEDFSKIEDFQASVDAAEAKQNLEEFEKLVEEHEIPRPPKNRGEGTFSAKSKNSQAAQVPEVMEISDEMQKLSDSMDGPKFSNQGFTEDVFGSIEELMKPMETTKTTKMQKTTKTTTIPSTTTTTTTPRPTTTTRTTTTTTTTTTPAPTTTTTETTTTQRRTPMRVTPRLPTVIPEDTVELVTPSMPSKVEKMNPEMINFFEEEMMVEQQMTTKKPFSKKFEALKNPDELDSLGTGTSTTIGSITVGALNSVLSIAMVVDAFCVRIRDFLLLKHGILIYCYCESSWAFLASGQNEVMVGKTAIHYGEVIPKMIPTATTTQAPPPPPPTTTVSSGFPIPEEISLDTLHALDWMLANMTKAAEEEGIANGNELRLRLDNSSPSESIPPSTKILSKKPKPSQKKKKNRVKTHRTKIIQLHYGEVVPAEQANRKFPKFRAKNAHRAKVYGIKTSSIPEEQLKIQTKKEELVDEINDLRDLMEQMDERIESRSALMEDNYDNILKPKHEHDSPYRHRQV
ncbi:hypothetical protein GCK72_001198 [Caenorhabditis remanei]|uniref:Uncharacterized protein n=1 Tax=Caenorhabditis remanei TaxID=31234 RepID=A0A6A5HQ76_CAERE|nr:hypothetical protein GCK72_001198 [Caenorhabditis remanei]KAF1769381.1 hypothetical protein GCK72_001198 [Caenorhabditis remanei]